MVTAQSVEEQLKAIRCNFRIWGRSEIRELANILMPDEKIAQAANGMHEGGFALLCVTQYRVLLVDKKPMMLTVEDMRYDMIAEVDFHTHLLTSAISIMTPMRNLVFSSWSHRRLRESVGYIQQRVMELRQHGMGMTAQQQIDMQKGAWRPQQGGPQLPMNPYTRTSMLTKRRPRFPSFY